MIVRKLMKVRKKRKKEFFYIFAYLLELNLESDKNFNFQEKNRNLAKLLLFCKNSPRKKKTRTELKTSVYVGEFPPRN